MSQGLSLQDISSLLTLQSRLGEFGNQIADASQAAGNEVARALEWIEQVIFERQNELEQARERVSQAEAALSYCENSGYYSPEGYYIEPDCTPEQIELAQANYQRERCERRLEKAQRWQGQLDAAANDFRRELEALYTLANEHTRQAQAALGAIAERYAAVHQAMLGYPPTITAPPPSAMPPTTVSSGDLSRLATGASPMSSAPAAIPAPATGWKAPAMRSVALGALPPIEGIQGAADFHKVTMDEVRQGLARLQEMLPVIENGEGQSSQHWQDFDRRKGLDYQHGYQRIYDAFYGQNAIRVEKTGDQYNIINGRHRIWLAQLMNILHLPMLVVEKKE